MLLGALLRQLEDERLASQMLMALGDVTLAMRVEKAAARFGETAAEYAAGACARFGEGAGDEDWLALTSALERGADPALTCLRAMIEWSLKHDAASAANAAGCSCGGQGNACEGSDRGPA